MGQRLSAHWENRNLSVVAENRAPEIVGEHCKKKSYWEIEIEKKGTKAKEIMKHLHHNLSQPIPLFFIFLFVLPSSSLSRNVGAFFFGFMYVKMPIKSSADVPPLSLVVGVKGADFEVPGSNPCALWHSTFSLSLSFFLSFFLSLSL